MMPARVMTWDLNRLSARGGWLKTVQHHYSVLKNESRSLYVPYITVIARHLSKRITTDSRTDDEAMELITARTERTGHLVFAA